jgi:hypothetical protein
MKMHIDLERDELSMLQDIVENERENAERWATTGDPIEDPDGVETEGHDDRAERLTVLMRKLDTLWLQVRDIERANDPVAVNVCESCNSSTCGGECN